MSIRQTVEFTSVTDIGFAFFKKKSVADASRKLSIFYIFFLQFLFSHSLYFSFSWSTGFSSLHFSDSGRKHASNGDRKIPAAKLQFLVHFKLKIAAVVTLV